MIDTDETAGAVERIKNDPEFHELVAKRSAFAWLLTVLMMLIYFGFILLVAFQKDVLGRSISGGVTTLGIALGIGVIVSAFVLTGVYVLRANATFDAMTSNILKRVKR